MLYVNQLDYPNIPYPTRLDMEGEAYEKGQHTTVASSACGLCSAMMMLDRLWVDENMTIEEMVAFSNQVGANRSVGTSLRVLGPALAERFHLRYVMSSSAEELKECLRTGGCAIANVAKHEGYTAVFTAGGHYIAVIGVEPDGRFAILDPSYKEGKFDIPERAGKVEMKGKIALCSEKTLMEDTEARADRRFHLFWRA